MNESTVESAEDILNRLFAQAYARREPQSNRSSLIYYTPPKTWAGTVYLFGYTPWRTRDPETGKTGFWALKYRVLKSGQQKLVKKVRFGRRKIAAKRSLKWYTDFYQS